MLIRSHQSVRHDILYNHRVFLGLFSQRSSLTLQDVQGVRSSLDRLREQVVLGHPSPSGTAGSGIMPATDDVRAALAAERMAREQGDERCLEEMRDMVREERQKREKDWKGCWHLWHLSSLCCGWLRQNVDVASTFFFGLRWQISLRFQYVLTITNPSLEDLGSHSQLCFEWSSGTHRNPFSKGLGNGRVPLRAAGVQHLGAENAIRRADLVRWEWEERGTWDGSKGSSKVQWTWHCIFRSDVTRIDCTLKSLLIWMQANKYRSFPSEHLKGKLSHWCNAVQITLSKPIRPTRQGARSWYPEPNLDRLRGDHGVTAELYVCFPPDALTINHIAWWLVII